MKPTVHNLPLKIIHDFPYATDAPVEEKRRVVTAYLTDIASRGFGGLVTNVSTRNQYCASAEEWGIFAHVAAECERMGLRLWIYDEKGYPSGAAGGLTLAEDPDYEARAVVLVTEPVAPGATVTLPLPHGHEHFLYAGLYALSTEASPAPVCDKSLGVAMRKADRCPLEADAKGRYVPLCVSDCRRSTADVVLENPTDAPVMLCAFVQKRLYEGTHCVHNVFDCRRYIDVTNRDAVAAFLRNTYDGYAKAVPEHLHAGAGAQAPAVGQIEAVFTDEPSFMGCYINKGLYPAHVSDPYDEALPLYPVLSYGRDVENAFAARYACELLPELVSIFLGDTEHAKAVRADYYALLSDLYEQAFFAQISDWCARHEISFSGHLLLEDTIKYHTVFEGNFFSLLRHMHYPGIDMLQSIPSVVRNYAFTPKIVSSVAKAYNRPHVMSEVSAHAQGGKVSHDQMYASLCAQYALGVDVFTYYYGERFMDPETYTRYNHALGRIDAVMAGRTVADCLLYYPIETFRRHHKPSAAQYGTYTAAEDACEAHLRTVMFTLLDRQIDFDFMDAALLSRSTVTEDGIRTPAGDVYPLLILPPMEATAETNASLSGVPETGLLRVSAVEAAGAVTLDGFAEAIEAKLTDRALVAKGVNPAILRLVRDTDQGRACLLVNTAEEAVTATFTLRGMASPVLYDPMTDDNRAAAFAAVAGGHRFTVTLGAMESLIVREA